MKEYNYRRELLDRDTNTSTPTALILPAPMLLSYFVNLFTPVLGLQFPVNKAFLLSYLQSYVHCSTSSQCSGQDSGTKWWPSHLHFHTETNSHGMHVKVCCEVGTHILQHIFIVSHISWVYPSIHPFIHPPPVIYICVVEAGISAVADANRLKTTDW